MKRFLKLALCAAVVAAPASLVAQNARPISVGVSGGLSLPMGDIGNAYSSGYSVAGHVFLAPASRTALGFRGDISYDSWGSKTSLPGGDATFTSMAFLGNVLLKGGDAASMKRPYLVAGAGMVRSKAKISGASSGLSSSSSDLAVQGGVGMEFALSGFSTFAEVKYVNAFLDGGSLNYVPITFGIKF